MTAFVWSIFEESVLDNRPIGVFDSGLGGLSAVKELQKLLPNEHIVYFGDTGRVPYGTKSYETIKRYAEQDVRFLESFGVKAVLAACGTVSAVALDDLKQKFSIPLYGVVDDAAKKALRETKTGVIAVAGTEATIGSGIFERKLSNYGLSRYIGAACPLFVALVECGFYKEDDEVAYQVCERYLGFLRGTGADTLILGCTHFPILAPVISKVLPGVKLINPAYEAAVKLKETLDNNNLLSLENNGKVDYYVSDQPIRFENVANIFLAHDIEAKMIDIEKV